MQYTKSVLLTGATFLTSVSAHGFLTSPTPRNVGNAYKDACGQQVFNNQQSDSYGNIQGILQVARNQNDFTAAKCNVWLCKGYMFADNAAANVQKFTPGQVVPFKFDLRAPHAGVANVSIVDTATNKIIGSPLLSYSDFANNARPTEANQLSFSITIPQNLGSKCAVAGACVIQHFWDAASIDQTYESCIDFTVAGSGSGSSGPSTTTTPIPTTLQTSTRPPTNTASPDPEEEEECEDEPEEVPSSSVKPASATTTPTTKPSTTTTPTTTIKPTTTVAVTTSSQAPPATTSTPPYEEEEECEDEPEPEPQPPVEEEEECEDEL